MFKRDEMTRKACRRSVNLLDNCLYSIDCTSFSVGDRSVVDLCTASDVQYCSLLTRTLKIAYERWIASSHMTSDHSYVILVFVVDLCCIRYMTTQTS